MYGACSGGVGADGAGFFTIGDGGGVENGSGGDSRTLGLALLGDWGAGGF